MPNIIKATVTAGMLSQAPGIDWILDPDNFRIVTSSTIPANHGVWVVSADDTAELPDDPAKYQRASAPPPADATQGAANAEAIVAPPPQMLLQLDYGTATYSGDDVWAPDLNIAPMDETGVASYHTITVLKADEDGQFTDPTYITGVTVAPQLNPSSTALWGAPGQVSNPNADRLIPATLTGFAISPVPRHPDQVSDVPLLSLIYGPGNSTGFGYQSPAVDQQYTVDSQVTTQDETSGQTISTFTITVTGAHTVTLDNQQYVLSTLTDSWVASQRTATLDQLTQLGFGTLPSGEVQLDLMAGTALTDWPSAARIGTETFA
jgi:hypothetical protein